MPPQQPEPPADLGTPERGTPYAGLDPAAVLTALESVGFYGDGRVLQLNSYENRVYQAHLEDGRAVVAKFYRPHRWSDAQILEEHGFALALSQAEVPVVAPCVLTLANTPVSRDTAAWSRVVGEPPTLAHARVNGTEHRIAVSPRCAGRAPNLEDPSVLGMLGRYLGRLHAVGQGSKFKHRRSLDVATLGRGARDRIAAMTHLEDESARDVWLRVCDEALQAVEHVYARVGPVRTLRLHGDFHPGNVLWRDVGVDGGPGGPHIVDLDDACNGPAVQDLWMLLSGDMPTRRRELDVLLAGYRMFADFDARELGLIEALRTLRMIHHSAWIAERWIDPAFPAAFPWFGTPGYWAQQATQLREQIDLMRDDSVDAPY